MRDFEAIRKMLDKGDECCCRDCEEYGDCDEIDVTRRLIKDMEVHFAMHNCQSNHCDKMVELDLQLEAQLDKLEECAWRHEDCVSRY